MIGYAGDVMGKQVGFDGDIISTHSPTSVDATNLISFLGLKNSHLMGKMLVYR